MNASLAELWLLAGLLAGWPAGDKISSVIFAGVDKLLLLLLQQKAAATCKRLQNLVQGPNFVAAAANFLFLLPGRYFIRDIAQENVDF